MGGSLLWLRPLEIMHAVTGETRVVARQQPITTQLKSARSARCVGSVEDCRAARCSARTPRNNPVWNILKRESRASSDYSRCGARLCRSTTAAVWMRDGDIGDSSRERAQPRSCSRCKGERTRHGSKRGVGVSPQEAEPETQCGGAGESEHTET